MLKPYRTVQDVLSSPWAQVQRVKRSPQQTDRVLRSTKLEDSIVKKERRVLTVGETELFFSYAKDTFYYNLYVVAIFRSIFRDFLSVREMHFFLRLFLLL